MSISRPLFVILAAILMGYSQEEPPSSAESTRAQTITRQTFKRMIKGENTPQLVPEFLALHTFFKTVVNIYKSRGSEALTNYLASSGISTNNFGSDLPAIRERILERSIIAESEWERRHTELAEEAKRMRALGRTDIDIAEYTHAFMRLLAGYVLQQRDKMYDSLAEISHPTPLAVRALLRKKLHSIKEGTVLYETSNDDIDALLRFERGHRSKW